MRYGLQLSTIPLFKKEAKKKKDWNVLGAPTHPMHCPIRSTCWCLLAKMPCAPCLGLPTESGFVAPEPTRGTTLPCGFEVATEYQGGWVAIDFLALASVQYLGHGTGLARREEPGYG